MFVPVQPEQLFAASVNHLSVSQEYLCLPNFMVIGSEVIEESNCTLFTVDKIYGWSDRDGCYSACLFEVKDNLPTVGVWKNDCLTIYLESSAGYLRMSYLARCGKPKNIEHSNRYYQLFAESSIDGVSWQRIANGKYEC